MKFSVYKHQAQRQWRLSCICPWLRIPLSFLQKYGAVFLAKPWQRCNRLNLSQGRSGDPKRKNGKAAGKGTGLKKYFRSDQLAYLTEPPPFSIINPAVKKNSFTYRRFSKLEEKIF